MLKRTVMSLAAVAAIAAALPAAAQEWDILIRNATVVDGTGAEPFAADVAVKNGKIAFVGKADAKAAAKDVIDARGLTLSPGFIDVHNHVTHSLLEPVDYTNSAYVTQGVTLIVSGPDGWMSPSEIRAELERFEKTGFGTNYAYYVGHNGIRREVMGHAQRAPNAEELERMKALVREGMEMGAVGFSTGLMYEPGMFSDTAEVIALAREVAPYDGTYDSHTRNPVHDIIGSESEAIEVGKAAGIPAKLGHLKAVGLKNKGRIGEVIKLVEEARAAGFDVVSDQYPYDGAATGLLEDVIVLGKRDPDFHEPQTREAVLAAVKDPADRAKIKDWTENGIDGGFSWVKAVGYGSMRVVHAPGNPELVGENIELLARKRNQDPFDLVVDLIAKSDKPVMVTLGAIDEADVRALMVQPWNMVSSDGGYVHGDKDSFHHPRSTGTFTRILGHYVRDEGVLTLAEAVRKMTSLPAEHLRLHDRGRIAVGYAADIAIFDAARVRDRSTWTDPTALSEGVVHVLVNGVPVLRDEKMTGAKPGKFIKRQKKPN